jgi:hypothetical protein
VGCRLCTIQSENMSSSRCTHVWGTPSLFLDMICTSQEQGLQVTTLQAAGCAGAPCSDELDLKIKQTLNVKTLFVSKFTALCLYVWVLWANVFSPYFLVVLRNRMTCEIVLKILWEIHLFGREVKEDGLILAYRIYGRNKNCIQRWKRIGLRQESTL